MLAHELRNPLAAISSAIELLQLRGSRDPMLQRAREAAVRRTAHMSRLLDDLLDVARVTQGKVMLNKSDVSLQSVLDSAVRGDLREAEFATTEATMVYDDFAWS